VTGRWPLHPLPLAGEALTSWLNRTALIYGLSIEDLVRHNLAVPGSDYADQPVDLLDVNTPAGILSSLTARTGVSLDRVRKMTIAGWAPWLLDTLEPDPEGNTTAGAAFDTYVQQNSVLLRPKERRSRQVPGWRAWLPIDPKRNLMCRACPTCVSTAPPGAFGFTLVSQLPLTLTCPHHNSLLAPAFGATGILTGWERQDMRANAAPDSVNRMDSRTHDGMRNGMVSLPRRSVHVGVWFRLLRTLLDELSTPVSALGVRSFRNIQRIWQTVDHPERAGVRGPWRAYEALPWGAQQAMLEAAATALHLIEAGEITAYGTLAPLLTPEPARILADGTPPPARQRDRWNEAHEAMNAVITEACEDAAAARGLLGNLTAWTRSEARFQRTRNDLIALGVPEHYLQQTLMEAQTCGSQL
jgi:hypothetical protein